MRGVMLSAAVVMIVGCGETEVSVSYEQPGLSGLRLQRSAR